MSKWKIGHWLQQGLSHIDEGKVCQDHFECAANEAGSCIAAVLADGLGSRVHSELASQAATKAAAKWLLDNSDWLCEAPDAVAVIQNQLLDRAKSAIRDMAREQMMDLEDMDCNMAFLCVHAARKKAVFGQLGDCAVCVLDEKPRVLTAQTGSAIGTNTVMTAHPNELRVEVIDLEETVNGFILTSDGLDGEIYRKNSRFVRNAAKGYFNTVFTEDPNSALKQKVLDLQNTRGGHFDDDISIVVLSQAKAPIDLPADPMWLCRCRNRNPLTASYCTKCHADFLSLYPLGVINRFEGLDEAILYLNNHQDEELEVLGLPPAPPESKPGRENQRREPRERQNKPRHTGDSRPDWAQAGGGDEPRPGPGKRVPIRSGLPGGSSAFVQQQAQQKHEESQVDTSRNANGTAGGSEHVAGQETASKQKTSWLGGFPNGVEILLLCVAAVIVIIFLVLGRFGPSRGKEPCGESTGPTAQQTQPHETRPRETEGRQPQAEDNYVGESRYGVPNGAGVLFEDGYFWVGTFVDGEKDGVFHKISARDTDEVELVEFDMGRELRETDSPEPTETTKHTEPQTGMRQYVVTEKPENLYESDSLTRKKFFDLYEGDIVFVDEDSRITRDSDGAEFVRVECEKGVAWCDVSVLVPLDEYGE